MKEKPNGTGRLFPDLRVPEPPEELRQQVLGRARQALENGAGADPWVRIWESRKARLAWAASALALAVGHLVMPIGDAGPAKEPSTLAQAGPGDREELAAIVSLPRLSLDARPIAASIRIPGETEAELDTPATPAMSEENAS